MLSRQTLRTGAAAVLLLLAPVPGAQAAQKVSGSGYGFYVRKSRDTYKLADERKVDQESNTGYLTTAQPDNPLNMNTQNCSGTTIADSDGKTGSGSGYCINFDADGDAAWMWFRGDLNAGTWGFIDGTGKFKGIDGGGTWKTKQRSPDGKFINTWEGTWQMK
jgi:hypothetical protein